MRIFEYVAAALLPMALACLYLFVSFGIPLLFGVSLWISDNVLEFFMGLFLILVHFRLQKRSGDGRMFSVDFSLSQTCRAE